MKLCPQCDFIYEDDQGLCDMDGTALVYEPTLQTVSKRAAPAQSLLPVPISTSLHSEGFEAPGIFAAPGSFGLLVAIGLVLAGILIAAFWISPSLFRTAPQTPAGKLETQNSKLETPPAKFETQNSKLETPPGKLEIQNSKLGSSESRDASESRNSNTQPDAMLAATRAAATGSRTPSPSSLPGLKPPPRLKPLPALKPLPRLPEQRRSTNASERSASVNTKASVFPKKESRFGSFLKKTGRILTKPFKP